MGFAGFGVLRQHEDGAGIAFGEAAGENRLLQAWGAAGRDFMAVLGSYEVVHPSGEIAAYGGVVNTMPKFAAFFMLFAMANAGLPATSGFVGEFMVILASFQQHPLIAFFAATTLVIGAAYTLWLVKRVILGDVANAHVAELKDVSLREALVLGGFAACVLALGVYPKPLTDLMEAPIAQLLTQLAATKL